MTEEKRAGRKRARAANLNLLASQRLREAADLLEAQDDNPFRVGAFRRAADAVESLDEDLRDIVDRGGPEALQDIPGVGESIAASLGEIVETGHWSYLDRLRGQTGPEDLFSKIPGVGTALAQRLHDVLHVDSLEQLEAALQDRACVRVPGLGPRRRASVLAAVAQMLSRIRRARPHDGVEPAVDVFLSVDAEYRQKALAGSLRRIAPLRNNPTDKSWLPIMHAARSGWHFTALFSNTARAHELRKTNDWVVIYFHAANGAESQRTVVTEVQGALAGKRVVRGREAECQQYYARLAKPPHRRNGTDRWHPSMPLIAVSLKRLPLTTRERTRHMPAMFRLSRLMTMVATFVVTLAVTGAAPASPTSSDLDRDAQQSLEKLYRSEPFAERLAREAKGILVFPEIVKAGLVFGGSYGKGVLLRKGKVNRYYNSVSGSWGLQAGAQSYGYALFLMNDKALNYLDRSDGWEIGVGPTVVVVDKGVAKNLSTTTLKDDAYAFIFDQQGLMAGIALEGSKISRIEP